jgi:hypothetical protein
MTKANQITLKKLARNIDWKKRVESSDSWKIWFSTVVDFMDVCDKWQIHYLIPEKTMGKHKMECGKIISKIPADEQILSIKRSTRKETMWIQRINVEMNCHKDIHTEQCEYIMELRKKINTLAENKDYAKNYLKEVA